MKPRISYKELSLLAGILVALLILLVIWLYPGESDLTDTGSSFQIKSVLPSVKLVLQKIHSLLQLSL